MSLSPVSDRLSVEAVSDESAVLMMWKEKSSSPTSSLTVLRRDVSVYDTHDDTHRERRCIKAECTYFSNLSKSPTTHRELICKTAKAEYPGSAMCLTLRMSRSMSSSLADSSYGLGARRYGGRDCPFVMLAESKESSVVISCVV